jgi:hypothetical protein
MACRKGVRRSAPRRLMVAAAESARQLCHCWTSARREGLRGEGACRRSTGIARAELAGAAGCSGRAKEICRKRLAQMKLSAKCGAHGSRRQEVPVMRCPRLRSNVSSSKATTGRAAGFPARRLVGPAREPGDRDARVQIDDRPRTSRGTVARRYTASRTRCGGPNRSGLTDPGRAPAVRSCCAKATRA